MDRRLFVRIAQVTLALAVVAIVVLHLLPAPMMRASTGALVPYDARVNFLSELVRTQYGPLMTANFVLLGAAAISAAVGVRQHGLQREALLLAGAGLLLALLALFPADLADLRTDASTCGDPARIEPCTWVGRVHDVLPNVAFVLLSAMWVSLARRRRAEWARIVRAGVACGLIAIVLVAASHLYLRHASSASRVWLGLMQRSVVAGAVVWAWLFLGQLGRARPASEVATRPRKEDS